jgi:hypothetical protein
VRLGAGAAGATDLYYAQASAVLDHSRTLPQGNGDAGPTLASGAIGGERNLIVLDASDVLYDAFAVRRSSAPVLLRLSFTAGVSAFFILSQSGRSGRRNPSASRQCLRGRGCRRAETRSRRPLLLVESDPRFYLSQHHFQRGLAHRPTPAPPTLRRRRPYHR